MSEDDEIHERPPAWSIRECLVEGCHVVIRTAPDADPGPAFCKWHQDGEVHVPKARAAPASGLLITKEEFGISLFDAVKICTGILQLRKMQQKADQKRGADYKTREAVMLTQLAALTPKLPVQDQQDLIARYPRLFT